MLQLNDHDLDAGNGVVLVVEDFLSGGCINIRLAGGVDKGLPQAPGLDLTVHFSVLFLDVPNSCF